jgi:hypothetical protein
MRGRRDSLATLKALFNKNYEAVSDQSEVDMLKSDYVVMVCWCEFSLNAYTGWQGSATKRTITLQINSDDIKVFVHDEDAISLNETVPFKVCKKRVVLRLRANKCAEYQIDNSTI